MAQGTIDQLNFEAIIVDKSFNSTVNALNKTAQNLNTSLTSILDHLGKQGVKSFNTMRTAAKATNTELVNMGSLLRNVGLLTGAAFSVVGIRRFLSTLIDVTGQFEVQKMALRNMLQDVEAADKIFKDLYDFSSRSTYRFSELAKYAKQLAAFNIDKNSLLETTKMLGDVASGVGVSMDRLILAYGHVKSSGFLRGIQLRSFSQNGVPILEELSKMFTEIEGKAVSLGDVFDRMMKRQIPFEMVEEAFKRMTSEGGKFYQMQEVLAKTLAGQINILKGKWENMMYAIGQSEEGVLKGTVQALTWIVNHMDSIANALKPVIVGLGAYGAALLVVGAAQKAMGLAKFAGEFLTMAKNLGLATAAVTAFGGAAKAAAVGLGLAVTAIAAIALIVRSSSSEMDKFRKRLDEVHETARNGNYYDREISSLERLRGILNNSNLSYYTRQDALNKLRNMVPAYHAELTQEGKLIHDNTKELDAYNEALKRKAMLRGAEDELVELYNLRRAAVREKEAAQKAKEEAGAVPAYVGGSSVTGAAISYSTETAAKYSQELLVAESKITEVDSRIAGIMKEIDEAVTTGADSTGDMVYNVSSIVEGIKRIDAELGSLRKKAKNEGISVEEKETLDQLKKDREEQAKLYKELMGVDYDKGTKAGESAQAKLIRERIAGIKAEIQVLQKYKQTYESMSGLLGSDMAKGVTNQIYGTNFTNFDFTSRIVELTDSLRTLGDTAGADSVLSSLGLGEGKELEAKLKKAQQIAKTYRGLIEAWDAKDMDADDDTFLGKLTKIVSDLNTKSNELFLKFKKGKETLRGIDINDPTQRAAVVRGLMDEGMSEEAANEFWDTFVAKGETALTELYVSNLGKLRTNAQQSVNALADTWVKEQTKNMSLTQWGDKSIGQVRQLYKDLKTLAEGEGIDDEMRKRLEATGLAVEDFRKLAKAEFEKLSKEAKEELVKKAIQSLRQFASEVGSLSNEIKTLAEASGNEGLAAVADGMSEIADVAGNVLEGFSQGDWIGAAVAGVTSIATGMLQAVTEAERFKRELAEAAEEARVLTFKESLSSGVDSIFGEDGLKKLNNAADALGAIKETISSLNETRPEEFRKKNSFWYRFGKGFGRDNKYERYSLREMAESIGRGGDLYDKYGNLNSEVLQEILEKYDKLKESDKDWITQAMHNSEMYAAAMEQLEQVMESVVGDVASSAADTIVNGWIEARKAALDYTDILDDVAQAYSKMVIKSMIMDEENGILNSGAVKALTDAFVNGDSEKAMSLIEGDLQAIANLEPVFQQVLETFDPYFKRDGSERSASSKALQTNFSQDTIDYWSGQLTLLVEFARRGDEQRENIANLVLAIKENMGGASGDGNYASNVQTYLATIQGDTSAIRSDIYAMKLAIQNMNDKGVKML